MSPELEAAIERMRNHVMTPEEKFEQRVSFVYGQQDHDKPGKSKDEIRQMLIDSTGYPPCQKCAALEASQAGAGDVMREALIKCRDQFLFYAESHRAKETPDGYAKAVTNQNMAMMCEDALTTPPRIEASQQEAELRGRIQNLESVIRAYTDATGFRHDAACPICNGIEGCDHSFMERYRATPPIQAAEMKDDEHTPVIGSNKIRRTFKKPNNQSSQAAESGLLEEALEVLRQIAKPVHTTNSWVQSLQARIDMAQAFLAKAGKPQP